MKQDAADFARKCDKCQRYLALIRAHPERLMVIFCPWPFAKWVIDIIGPPPTAPGGLKFAVVAVDYFTKWAEAIPLSSITEKNLTKFIHENIIFRFGIPHSLVSDNALQFDNQVVRELCDKFGTNKDFFTPYYPQSNGQVEAVNKIIKAAVKRRLDTLERRWDAELLVVLWSYRTTARAATGETPFSMAYGSEAMIPTEVKVPSFRYENFDEETNASLLAMEKDMIEERREVAKIRIEAQKQHMARYYDSKVKERKLKVGDTILRQVFQNTKEPGAGAPGYSWEGPYQMTEVLKSGAYRIVDLAGVPIRNP